MPINVNDPPVIVFCRWVIELQKSKPFICFDLLALGKEFCRLHELGSPHIRTDEKDPLTETQKMSLLLDSVADLVQELSVWRDHYGERVRFPTTAPGPSSTKQKKRWRTINMYDPMTVAFEIKSPFGKKSFLAKGSTYRETLITIWHVDPEVGGDDNSCGFTYVRLTHEDKEWAKKFSMSDWSNWFSDQYKTLSLYDSDDIGILTQAWLCCRVYVNPKMRGEDLKSWEISEILTLLGNAMDNVIRHCRAAREGPEGLEELLLTTLRIYKTRIRPWYRRPRWHIHHWQIQIRPLETLKRFLFSRCAKCGKKFSWGYSPYTHQWGGDGGPKWFRSEKNVFHGECMTIPTKMTGTVYEDEQEENWKQHQEESRSS